MASENWPFSSDSWAQSKLFFRVEQQGRYKVNDDTGAFAYGCFHGKFFLMAPVDIFAFLYA
jgi:hypothetical protein